MTPDTLASITQFGVAGLIGWMWLAERRAAAERDRQLSAAHDTILHERARLDVLISALDANTRAITALEVGQRHLVSLFDARYQPRRIDEPPPREPRAT